LTIRDLYMARKPAAIWAKLKELGNAALGPAFAHTIEELAEYRWPIGTNVMGMIAQLQRLNDNFMKHLAVGASEKSEAERIVHLSAVVKTAHGPIFGSVIDKLDGGKEDGNLFPISRYHHELRAKEGKLGGFTVWQYKALHLEAYKKWDDEHDIPRAKKALAKRAFAAAASAGIAADLDEYDDDTGPHFASAAAAAAMQFVFCAICGKNHTADVCTSPNVKVCADCGWRYNKLASPGKCPSKFHAEKVARNRKSGAGGGGNRGRDGSGGGGGGGGKKQGAQQGTAVANAATTGDFSKEIMASLSALTASISSIKATVDKNTEDINALL
jgi:uncharacterized membrane protein YgcG